MRTVGGPGGRRAPAGRSIAPVSRVHLFAGLLLITIVVAHAEGDEPAAGRDERHVRVVADPAGWMDVGEHLWNPPRPLGFEARGSTLGWLHGVAYRAHVRAALQGVQPALSPERLEEARRLLPGLDPDFDAELEGLAAGAQVPAEALLALELLPADAAGAPAPLMSMVALGAATSMGQALHAVALDATSASSTVVLFNEAGAIPLVLLGAPGRLGGWSGMNLAGLSVSAEEFERVRDDGDVLPTRWLVRDVLRRAHTLEEAVAYVKGLARTHGIRVTILDGPRRAARVIERRGSDVQMRRPNEGLLAGYDPDAPLGCFEGACDPDVPRADPLDPARTTWLRAQLGPAHGVIRASLLEAAMAGTGEAASPSRVAAVFQPQTLAVRVRLDADASWRERNLAGHLDILLNPFTLGPRGQRLSAPRERRLRGLPQVEDAGEVRVTKKPVPLPGISIHGVEFASPASSGFAANDRIRAVYYEPHEVRGAVIVLPAWKESNLVGQGLLAIALAQKGYAALVLPLPYQVDRALEGFDPGQMTLSADLARTRQAFLQGAADAARASRWLETRGIEPVRQAVMGTSLGGHVAALAYGAYPERFGAGVFLLAGGDISTALLQPNRTTGRLRKALLERGVTPEEALPLMEVVDGVTWADPTRGAGVLVVGAKEDDVVPPANVKALAAAYGGARLEWLEGDHYGILRQLPKTIAWVVDHLGKALPPR